MNDSSRTGTCPACHQGAIGYHLTDCPQCGCRLPWARPPQNAAAIPPVTENPNVRLLPPTAPTAPDTRAAGLLNRADVSFGWVFLLIIIAGLAMGWYLFWPMLKKKEYAYNVHFMMGKGVDSNRDGVEIGEVEGYLMDPPVKEADEKAAKKAGLDFVEEAWQNKKGSLVVTYRIFDRKVIRFYLPTNEPSGVTTDKESLLTLGNLKDDDPDYIVQPVPISGNSSSFVGIHVIPRAMASLNGLK